MMGYAYYALTAGVGRLEVQPLSPPNKDGGSWPAPLTQQAMLLGVARADGRVVAVGEFGHILLSDDEGKTWRQAKSVPTRTTLTAVQFIDPKNGWAVGHDTTVLRTTDGGETWSKQYGKDESDNALMTIIMSDAQRGLALGAFNFTVETNDGGTTWTQRRLATAPAPAPAAVPPANNGQTPPAPTAPGSEGAVPPANDADLQSQADAEAEKKAQDAGVGGAYSAGEGDEAHLNGAFVAPNNMVVIAAEAGSVYRSLDGGATFTKVQTPYNGSFWNGMAMADGSLMVVGMRGNVWRSRDQGATWTKANTGSADQSVGGITRLQDGAIVLVGLGGQILVSKDGGENFVLTFRDDRKGLNGVIETRDGRVLAFGEVGMADITAEVKAALQQTPTPAPQSQAPEPAG